MPLSRRVDSSDDQDMLLAGLLMAGVVALIVVMGCVADELLGSDADRWARRVRAADEGAQSCRRQT
ncbi:hypothetical protein GCM10010530_43270 [Kribbella aluminosa]